MNNHRPVSPWFKTLAASVLAASSLLAFAPAHADLRAFACEPEWKALLDDLGDGEVETYAATTAQQDPHHVEARPGLMAKMRRADLVVCTGAGLESGWLPMVLRQSGNARVQPGGAGYFEAASVVTLLDVPVRVDRAQGDVHPEGNPHLHLDPRNIAPIARAVSARLAQLDPPHAKRYAARQADFDRRWQAALTRWTQQAAPLRGMAVVWHHRNGVYLARWLGLKEVGVLEPKPGLPPSAGHLSTLLADLQRTPARAVLRAAYEDGRPDAWLAERAKIPALVLPYTVGGDGAKDLFALFDVTLTRLLEVAR